MTELMEKVFGEVAKLPDEEQDYIATLIQRELAVETDCNDEVDAEPESIHELLREAREEIAQGKVSPLEDLL